MSSLLKPFILKNILFQISREFVLRHEVAENISYAYYPENFVCFIHHWEMSYSVMYHLICYLN